MKRNVFKTLCIRKHSEKVRDFCFQFLCSHNLKFGISFTKSLSI